MSPDHLTVAATSAERQPVTSFDDPRNRTLAEFLDIERISKTTYVDLRRRGYGPRELRVPNSKVIRITQQAHVEWRQRMAELANTEAAQLEAARRRQQAVEAGKRAAQSPTHVSRRRSTA